MLDHFIKEFLRAPYDIKSSMYSKILKNADKIINHKPMERKIEFWLQILYLILWKLQLIIKNIENIWFCFCEEWNDITI